MRRKTLVSCVLVLMVALVLASVGLQVSGGKTLSTTISVYIDRAAPADSTGWDLLDRTAPDFYYGVGWTNGAGTVVYDSHQSAPMTNKATAIFDDTVKLTHNAPYGTDCYIRIIIADEDGVTDTPADSNPNPGTYEVIAKYNTDTNKFCVQRTRNAWSNWMDAGTSTTSSGDGESTKFDDRVQVTFSINGDNVQDDEPPTSVVTLDPSVPDGNNSWYQQNVNISIAVANDDCYLTSECDVYVDIGYGYWRYGEEYLNSTDESTELANGEGTLTLMYYVEDPLGHASNPAKLTIKVDKTPPTITELTGPTEWVNSSSFTIDFSWAGADAISKVGYYSWYTDGSTVVHNTTETTVNIRPPPGDGNRSFFVRAIDNAGWMSDWAEYKFSVDRMAPVVRDLAGPEDWVNNGTTDITFTWTGADDLGAEVNSTVDFFEYKIDDGEPALCTSPLTIPTPEDGEYTLYVRATDKAGNVGEYASLEFKVDTTLPVVTDLVGPTEWVNGSTDKITFTMEGEDHFGPDVYSGIKGFEYRIDEGEAQACSSPLEIDVPDDGLHTIQVRAIDNASNVGEYASLEFKVDTTPPTVNITGPTWWDRNETVSFTVIGSDETSANDFSGIDKYFYMVDDGDELEGTTELSLPSGDDGMHTLKVRATDVAGNIGDWTSFEFKVDRTPPGVTGAELESGGLTTSSASFVLEVSLSDAPDGSPLSRLGYKVGAGDWQWVAIEDAGDPPTVSLPLTVTSAGEHEIALKAEDAAGNVGAELTVKVNYEAGEDDLLAPLISALAPADGASVTDRKPAISASYSDATTGGSGINTASVKLLLDGVDVTASATVSATGVQYTPATDIALGAHSLSLTVRDSSLNGNEATKTWSFTVVELVPDIVSIRITPDPLSLMVGQEVTLSVIGKDSSGVDHPGLPATLSVAGGVGTLTGMVFKATTAGTGTITAQYGTLTDDLPVTVVAQDVLPTVEILSVTQEGDDLEVDLSLVGAMPPGAKCMVRVDGGAWTEVFIEPGTKLTVDIADLEKGDHTLSVKLVMDSVETTPVDKEFTKSDEGGGASGTSLLLLALPIALIILVIIVALMLMTRRKGRPPADDQAPALTPAEAPSEGGGLMDLATMAPPEGEAPQAVAGAAVAAPAAAAASRFSIVNVNTFCDACGGSIQKGTTAYLCSCGSALHEKCAGMLSSCPKCKNVVHLE